MFYVILGVSALVYLFYKAFYEPQLYWKRKNVKQLPPVPVLGENWRILCKLEAFDGYLDRLDKHFKNERFFGIYQNFPSTLMIRDPELIKRVAVKDFDHFLDHKGFTTESKGDEVWNRNLFSLKGQTWKEMRATLSPTFTTSKMRAMFGLMEQTAVQYVNFYKKQEKPVIELEVKDSVTRFTNDVIANCAFGISVDSLNEPENEFYLNGKTLSNFSGFFKMLKFIFIEFFPKLATRLNMSIFPEYLGEYFKTIIRDAVSYREQHKIVRPDVIHLMMEAKKGLLKYEEDSNAKSSGFATVEESHLGKIDNQKSITMTETDMAAQALIFFLAGFDTVANAMTFMSYSLATNPDIQEKLRREIEEAYESQNGKITYDTLANLKYMDMVLSETLRRYPPAFFIDRVCTKPYTIPAEREDEPTVHLNVGDVIWIPIYSLQNDPDNFPEPKRFDPERFSDENKGSIKPYTFIPFGVGPRNCIGSRFALMEVKILFFHILREFNIVPIKKTPIPLKFKRGEFSALIEGGCWVGYEKRN